MVLPKHLWLNQPDAGLMSLFVITISHDEPVALKPQYHSHVIALGEIIDSDADDEPITVKPRKKSTTALTCSSLWQDRGFQSTQ